MSKLAWEAKYNSFVKKPLCLSHFQVICKLQPFIFQVICKLHKYQQLFS